MSSLSMKDQAIALLKDTSYFHDASDSLLESLASKMIPIQAHKGQILMEEGEEMHHILILESGTLVRTKLSVPAEEVLSMRSSLRLMTDSKKQHEERVTNSVIIDKVKGRGRITGLLHSCDTTKQSVAYATVSAETENVKVWLISTDDFRDSITCNSQNCLDMLNAMARELRVGSKSLRGLIEKVKNESSEHGDSTNKKNIIKVLCYDTTSWVSEGFKPAIEEFNKKQIKEHGEENALQIKMDYTSERLSERSATYAAGYTVVCLFVNDTASQKVLQTLSLLGIKMITMRCAGYDRVDTKAAIAYGLTVVRVPAYSPYAVAEMAMALLLAVNRKIAKANARIKMANFTLDAGLMGFDIYGKTIGVMGIGKIGQILCNIILGFGAKLLCYDLHVNDDIQQKGGIFVTQEELYKQSDVIFLMMPLLPTTYHTINENTIQQMKKGVIIINTSRGGLINTKDCIKGIQNGIIAGLGIDVYENEQEYFFQDWSARNIQDTELLSLIADPKVVMTAHQSFFTKEAVTKIVNTTIDNIYDFSYNGKTLHDHPNNCLPN